MRGIYGEQLDEEGAYAIGRAYVEEFEPRADRGRPRHARARAGDGRGRDRGCRGRRRGRCRPRDGRDRDALFRRRRARPRRRDRGHRLAQSEGVHGHEDRPRAARCRSAASRGCCEVRDRALAATSQGQSLGQVRTEDVYPAFVERVLSFVDVEAIAPLRVVIDAANGMAGAMLPPVLARLPIDAVTCLLRAGRHVSEPRAEPAAAGEPRVHRRQDARGRRGSRRRVRRRRRPVLLRRRHGRVRPGRLRHGAARGVDPREGAAAAR